MSTDIVAIGHRYFETMGIPVTSGRGFDRHDDATSERVAIVNETLASRLWPSGAAVPANPELRYMEALPGVKAG